MKYNLFRQEIAMNTNLGELKMSYADAFEIMLTFLDAVETKVEKNEDIQKLLEKIDSEFCLDKF